MANPNPAIDILPAFNTSPDDQNQSLLFYCAWFCPYAQRVWIALQYFGVPYHYNEIQLYESVKDSFSISRIRVPLEKKPKEFVEVSPLGLVPALNHEGKGIHESILCMEYLEDVYSKSSGKTLLPLDPYQKFLVRKVMILIDEKIIKYFYEALLIPDDQRREEAKEMFLSGLEEFGTFMLKYSPVEDTNEFNFCVGSNLTFGDIMFAPWFYRIDCVLGPLRGFKLPGSNAALKRVLLWWNSVSHHPAVKSTFVKKEALLESYTGYSS